MRDPGANWRFYEATLEEIAGERAHTLGRAAERLEKALAVYRPLAEAADDTKQEQTEAALREARDAAWALLVQRECAGLRSGNFDWLREYWQVPEEVLRRI